MARSRRVALVYGAPGGVGGLGAQVASAIQGLAIEGVELHAFGPGTIERWPLRNPVPQVAWHQAPRSVATWRARYTWLRWWTGELVLEESRAYGRWAARQIERLAPDCCYVFTQVGLETLRWARRAGVASIVDNPNGHIRNFRRVYEEQSRRWCGAPYRGHPTRRMADRVENEYLLADRVRVSSQFARRSMVAGGVTGEKIAVIDQPVDLMRFHPAPAPLRPEGPVRICFVGALDLRKGFVYLLRAAKLAGASELVLEIVGATGDRASRSLFERESAGLSISSAPGDPVAAYHRAELLVLPSLEDGFGFAVAEAMACGLPVIVTDCCGAAEWVRPGESGWVVRAGDSENLAAALRNAIEHREVLPAMGRIAREEIERRAGADCLGRFRQWAFGADLEAA